MALLDIHLIILWHGPTIQNEGQKFMVYRFYPRKKKIKINDEVSRYLPQNDDKP